jgi:hypothetical protein
MAFSYTHGLPIPYWTPIATYTRGVAVLRWADDDIANDKTMVQYLVWANPSNIAYASAALKADEDIVSTAMMSPYYLQPEPAMPPSCVLRYVDENIRNNKTFILDHLASSAYEMQFLGPHLRNDRTVIAWAGAPHGAISTMLPDHDFLKFLKDLPPTGLSFRYVENNQKRVFDFHAKYLVNKDIFNGRKICMETHWGRMKESEKIEWCKWMWGGINEKLPLYFRVSPAMREVLWPTATYQPVKFENFTMEQALQKHSENLKRYASDATDAFVQDVCPEFSKNGFWGSESVLGEQR